MLKTYVGNKPDSLIVSGSDQCIIAVCSQFGVYVNFSVELPKEETDVLVSRPNAFSIMIAAQRRIQLGDNGLLYPKVVKDNRDRLYNDDICLTQEMGVRWTAPQRYGVPFLENLSNALWYIDGHYSTIGEKAPEVFSRFTGYNCPENHKHRKQTMNNLSHTEILAHSLALQDSLQASWFKKEAYKELMKVTTELMSSLNI